jgi:quercetin dioxygenase-like cupin family protein
MKNILKLIEYPKKGVLSKEIFKDSKNNITLFCMAAGTEMSEHTTTKTAFVQVIEGEGIFMLEKEKIKMLAGVFIPMEKNALHALKAIKNTSFMLYLN